MNKGRSSRAVAAPAAVAVPQGDAAYDSDCNSSGSIIFNDDDQNYSKRIHEMSYCFVDENIKRHNI